MKIIVVDDSRAMRMIVTRTLRQAGYGGNTIVEARDGLEALGLLQKDRFDLILSDWNMPEMTGIDLLDAVRQAGISTPFFFVTSESSPEMRERAEVGGADGLIGKPFTADHFCDVLDPVLG